MDLLVPEVISFDGAYKGRIHVIVPFIGRKNRLLTARQRCCNDVHGWDQCYDAALLFAIPQ